MEESRERLGSVFPCELGEMLGAVKSPKSSGRKRQDMNKMKHSIPATKAMIPCILNQERHYRARLRDDRKH